MVIAELPHTSLVQAATDADLDSAFGVEHAGKHRLAEWAAVVKFGAVDFAHRVAMRVDMDETNWAVLPEGLQDRIGDRMIAADRQWPHPGHLDPPIGRFDVLDATVEAEPRAHWHVADIGRGKDRLDACTSLCRAQVDAANTPMGRRTAHDRRVQHAVGRDIGNEGAAPSEQSRVLDPFERLPHISVGLDRHRSGPGGPAYGRLGGFNWLSLPQWPRSSY